MIPNRVAIVGNPNSGKTTIFNELTGLNQKVGNYPGVTVERKEGTIHVPGGSDIEAIDLPGTYSLIANSPDQQVTSDLLLGLVQGVARPDAVVCVVDASNLERSLYLVSQVMDLGYPTVMALNMMDVAEDSGVQVDVKRLEDLLGISIVPTVGCKRIGIRTLKETIASGCQAGPVSYAWKLPDAVAEEFDELSGLLAASKQMSPEFARHEAIKLLSTPLPLPQLLHSFDSAVLDHVQRDYDRLEQMGVDRHAVFVESRIDWIRMISQDVARQGIRKPGYTDRIDAVVTHPFWGYVILFALLALMFQSIFTWASIPMDLIGDGFSAIGTMVDRVLPEGDLRDLVAQGIIAGMGAVVTFVPQIAFLFLFLGILEDTGYMARAAFIMDRLMNTVGLHGRAFIPILSSFACAIPGIMAARTIDNPRDRLVTMLVAPLAGCSARLPVYSLLIAAFIPAIPVFGFWNLQGLVMVGLYAAGVAAALAMAWVLKKFIVKGKPSSLILELPPYRFPSPRNLLLQVWERSSLFLKRAGTIILGISILLWFLATYPKTDSANPSERLAHSFVGRAGHLIEPLIQPLGFDWKIGIGILTSLLQREVFVSTVSTIYSIADAGDNPASLRMQMEKDIDPLTGHPKFTVLTAICLMVYYVLALQCMSTVAVMRRETNGWKWPMFQLAYMSVLAYGTTFIVYRIGLHFF